jgi:hypothetical protein
MKQNRSGLESLEERLRSGAHGFAPAPPPELRARILEALRTAEPPAPLQPRVQPPARPAARPADPRNARRGNVLAAAAALLVLASAWWLTHAAPPRTPRAMAVVALSRGLLGAGKSVLALPAEAGDNLRLEAQRLLSDTTRVAEGVVRGLPAPLRAQLERM